MRIPKGTFRDIMDDLEIILDDDQDGSDFGTMLEGLGLRDGESYGQLLSVTRKELTWASPVSNRHFTPCWSALDLARSISVHRHVVYHKSYV